MTAGVQRPITTNTLTPSASSRALQFPPCKSSHCCSFERLKCSFVDAQVLSHLERDYAAKMPWFDAYNCIWERERVILTFKIRQKWNLTQTHFLDIQIWTALTCKKEICTSHKNEISLHLMNTPITLFYGIPPSTFDVNASIKIILKDQVIMNK